MLFEALIRQSYLGKQALNRFHFNSSGTPASVSLSFALASALGGVPDPITGEFDAGTVMRGFADVQSISVVYTELTVEALYDVEDFYAIPYPSSQHGLAAGTAMARYEAYPLRSNRVRTDVRRGFKRIAGVVEELVGVGGEIAPAQLEVLQDLADTLSAPLTYDDEGNTLTFTVAVLSFDEYTTPSGKPAYRPYPTLSEQLDHAALGVVWSAQPNTTTQNTRKRAT